MQLLRHPGQVPPFQQLGQRRAERRQQRFAGRKRPGIGHMQRQHAVAGSACGQGKVPVGAPLGRCIGGRQHRTCHAGELHQCLRQARPDRVVRPERGSSQQAQKPPGQRHHATVIVVRHAHSLRSPRVQQSCRPYCGASIWRIPGVRTRGAQGGLFDAAQARGTLGRRGAASSGMSPAHARAAAACWPARGRRGRSAPAPPGTAASGSHAVHFDVEALGRNAAQVSEKTVFLVPR